MKYRVTCLTPTLVGDGQRLAPIDYMVWKDQINVLDQRRIFKLLAKGPRLEGYLAQLKKAEKLDFASWGGFAQNFAGRRIPFEHSTVVTAWERTPAADLFIPTFATTVAGPYLPATSIKGALRTGVIAERWSEATIRDLAARFEGEERFPKHPSAKAEDAVLGNSHAGQRIRSLAAGDSGAITYAGMKVYLSRTATLIARGGDKSKFELGWKTGNGTSGKGSVDHRRVDDSLATFAEMASPGTTFEGVWSEHLESAPRNGSRSSQDRSANERLKAFDAANRYAAQVLARHREYAEQAGLPRLAESLTALQSRLDSLGTGHQTKGCLLGIGWGGGLLGKAAYFNTQDPALRSILSQIPAYDRALRTGMPFPKTRRIIFENGQPASIAGWVQLELL
jgi:CRISPR-associated protein Csm5